MKKCPFCAEQIQDEAIKCKHCGEMLPGAAIGGPKPVVNPRWVRPNIHGACPHCSHDPLVFAGPHLGQTERCPKCEVPCQLAQLPADSARAPSGSPSPVGALVLFVGLGFLVYGLSMSTSVLVPGTGIEVNNVGLMNDKNTYTMVGAALLLLGGFTAFAMKR